MDLPEPPEAFTPKGVEIESKARLELKGHDFNVHCVAYSPDGKLLFSGATDRSIRVWEADSGNYIRSLTTHTGTVLSLAVTRDGTRLASGSRDGTVVIWDLETYAPLEQFTIGGDVYGVAWSPDGFRLATAGGHEIVMHEKRDEKWKRAWVNCLDEVLSLAYAPDGDQVAAGNEYGSIRIFDADTGKLIFRAERGDDMREVRCIAYDPFKRSLASGSDDDLVHLWSTKLIETNQMGGHVGDVNAAVFTEDGSVLMTAGNDNRVRAWSPQTGAQYAEQRAGRSDLLALAIRPGADEIAIAGRDSTVRVYKFKVIN
jgi:WD40 repeat protein